MGKASGGEKRGMGLLFVFFPDDDVLKRSNPILSKAQSTVSICFLLFFFFTLLLLALSPFDPDPAPRVMSQGSTSTSTSYALQGMGSLFRRGTRPMTGLVVAHLVHNVTQLDLRLFLRLVHRSGLTARSDLLLLFDSPETARSFHPVIREENDSFFKLVDRYRKIGPGSKPGSPAGFELGRFVGSGRPEKEPVWGRKGKEKNRIARLSYGSVVGFYAGELDPEGALSGFFDPVVPMAFRRWACYPMLLGRVRRNFKHIMLVDVKNLLILGDPLGRVRNRSPESVLLTRPVDPAVVIGGSRGVRRLAGAMLTEIARSAMQHRGGEKSLVTELEVMSQLVGNEVVMKSKGIDLITSAEPVPNPNPSSTGSGFELGGSIIYCGDTNGNNIDEVRKVIMKQICSLEVESIVYSDCK